MNMAITTALEADWPKRVEQKAATSHDAWVYGLLICESLG